MRHDAHQQDLCLEGAGIAKAITMDDYPVRWAFRADLIETIHVVNGVFYGAILVE